MNSYLLTIMSLILLSILIKLIEYIGFINYIMCAIVLSFLINLYRNDSYDE
jgi:hypothetical protein